MVDLMIHDIKGERMKEYKNVYGPMVDANENGNPNRILSVFDEIMNQNAVDGWQYCSMEKIAVWERPGCLGGIFKKQPVQHEYYMLTFEREVGDSKHFQTKVIDGAFGNDLPSFTKTENSAGKQIVEHTEDDNRETYNDLLLAKRKKYEEKINVLTQELNSISKYEKAKRNTIEDEINKNKNLLESINLKIAKREKDIEEEYRILVERLGESASNKKNLLYEKIDLEEQKSELITKIDQTESKLKQYKEKKIELERIVNSLSAFDKRRESCISGLNQLNKIIQDLESKNNDNDTIQKKINKIDARLGEINDELY